eukprot:gene5720-9540_t
MYYIIENCMQFASPTERGTRLDLIVALSFLLEPQEIDPLSSLFKNSKIKIPDWWKNKKQNPFKIILPDFKSGPDTAILNDDILVFTGQKLSSTKTSVPTKEAESNFKKTDFINFYSEKTENHKQSIILDKMKQKKVKGIIRIHFIFPTGAKPRSSEPYFKPGIRVPTNKLLNIEEIIIDIDKSNLKDSKIFREENANLLLKYILK